MWKIKRGAFTKLLISQLQSVIERQTCFFFKLMLSKLSDEDVGACGKGTHKAKS